MPQLCSVGIWGNVRFRSGSRLFCREVGSFAEFLSFCFSGRFARPVEMWAFRFSELAFPVSWSDPVVMAMVMAWDDGGRSARMNYKPGKSWEKADEWPRRTATGAPETGAQPPQRHQHRAVALLQHRHRHRCLLRPIHTPRARPRATSGKTEHRPFFSFSSFLNRGKRLRRRISPRAGSVFIAHAAHAAATASQGPFFNSTIEEARRKERASSIVQTNKPIDPPPHRVLPCGAAIAAGITEGASTNPAPLHASTSLLSSQNMTARFRCPKRPTQPTRVPPLVLAQGR